MDTHFPRIVVLDGHTLNPGDLSWDTLGALGDLIVHDRTPAAQVTERAAGAEIVFTNKSLVPAKVIEALPELRYIGVLATGYNVVDTSAAAARNIPVTNIPGYGTESVAQMTFALLLELAAEPALHNASVRLHYLFCRVMLSGNIEINDEHAVIRLPYQNVGRFNVSVHNLFIM